MSPAHGGDAAALLADAHAFANTLTGTVWNTIGRHIAPFVGTAVEQTSQIAVRQEPKHGITLTVKNQSKLLLSAEYWCHWDHSRRFLAVQRSKFTVRSLARPAEPLFRVEYEREPIGPVPVAHAQIHAARVEWTDALRDAGKASRRGRRRARTSAAGDEPRLSEVHFPLGGHRFRPCLEDILTMLLDEFGVDRQEGAEAVLNTGRAAYRRTQLAAAIRDSPESAASALSELGYHVTPPTTGPVADRLDRLGQY